jgi:type VI secretion system protein ImpH
MAAEGGGTSAPVSTPASVAERLFTEGFGFGFFQAVRLLERVAPERKPVGRNFSPASEIVRFNAHLSLSFPASKGIFEILPPQDKVPATMIVTFMGLTGPSGELPQHYTELMLRLEREVKGDERRALREWLDLFNHRLISHFYRAWEKYRFWRAYERGEQDRTEPDDFTRALYSLIGLAMPPLRRRLHVSVRAVEDEESGVRSLARIDDLVLLYYSGFFAQRTRCAVSLQALLEDYFGLPARIQQFQGRWLPLDPASQSRMGAVNGNNRLGLEVTAGERVWEMQGKFRVRLGPLKYPDFVRLIPDRSPVPERKTFFLLVHLIRLYVGPEFDFDVQMVLCKEDVPPCRLDSGGIGPRLGWNTWIHSKPATQDAEDAAFAGEETVLAEMTMFV